MNDTIGLKKTTTTNEIWVPPVVNNTHVIALNQKLRKGERRRVSTLSYDQIIDQNHHIPREIPPRKPRGKAAKRVSNQLIEQSIHQFVSKTSKLNNNGSTQSSSSPTESSPAESSNPSDSTWSNGQVDRVLDTPSPASSKDSNDTNKKSSYSWSVAEIPHLLASTSTGSASLIPQTVANTPVLDGDTIATVTMQNGGQAYILPAISAQNAFKNRVITTPPLTPQLGVTPPPVADGDGRSTSACSDKSSASSVTDAVAVMEDDAGVEAIALGKLGNRKKYHFADLYLSPRVNWHYQGTFTKITEANSWLVGQQQWAPVCEIDFMINNEPETRTYFKCLYWKAGDEHVRHRCNAELMVAVNRKSLDQLNLYNNGMPHRHKYWEMPNVKLAALNCSECVMEIHERLAGAYNPKLDFYGKPIILRSKHFWFDPIHTYDPYPPPDDDHVLATDLLGDATCEVCEEPNENLDSTGASSPISPTLSLEIKPEPFPFDDQTYDDDIQGDSSDKVDTTTKTEDEICVYITSNVKEELLDDKEDCILAIERVDQEEPGSSLTSTIDKISDETETTKASQTALNYDQLNKVAEMFDSLRQHDDYLKNATEYDKLIQLIGG